MLIIYTFYYLYITFSMFFVYLLYYLIKYVQTIIYRVFVQCNYEMHKYTIIQAEMTKTKTEKIIIIATL